MITPGLVVGVVLLLGAPAALLAQQGVEDNIGAPANRVLELDGSGAHVELPSAPFADLSEATVEAWVRHDSWAYFSQWFAYATDTLWRSVGANHFSGTSTLQYFVYPGGSADLRAISVETALPLGRWYHMALVSGSQGMRFYLDGGLMGSNSHTGSFAGLEPATGVFLGHSPWKANQPFHGGLDEIRLWSVARSAEEIRADMGRPLRGDEPGLEGLWNFDAGDARDGTVRGGDGTLRNGAVCAVAPYPGLEPRPASCPGAGRDLGRNRRTGRERARASRA